MKYDTSHRHVFENETKITVTKTQYNFYAIYTQENMDNIDTFYTYL